MVKEGRSLWSDGDGEKTGILLRLLEPVDLPGFTKIEEVARRHNANLVWRPILVGGLFNTVNPSVYESREKPVKVKARYYTKDLQDWANFYKIKIGIRPCSRSIR